MPRVNIELTSTTNKFEAGLKNVAKSLEGFKELAIGAFSDEAVVSFIEKTIESADAVDKASLRLKMTTEQTQTLSIVAKQAGSSLETIETAFKKIELARNKALGGDAKILEAFKKEGITAQQLQLPNNTVNLAASLASAARNGSTDKEGVALMELGLKEASGDLTALGDNLQDFDSKVQQLKDEGAIMSDADIANLVRAKDELEILGTKAEAAIAPWLSQLIEGLEEGWIIIQTTAENVFTAIILLAENAVDYIKGLKDQLVNNGKNILEQTAVGYAKGGVFGAIMGGATATGKDGKSLASLTADYETKKNQIIVDAYNTNNNDLASRLDTYKNQINKELAERAKARQNKAEPVAPITPVKEKHFKVYSDSFTQTGNFLGAGFQTAGTAASQLDVSRQHLTEARKQTELHKQNTEFLQHIDSSLAVIAGNGDWD